ncbi:hypothetical protein CRG98_035390 [Punica granatum]|uniref:Mediator complex subunit 15 KIX domain-containing protein n=1 Tax=Punica granatum TaxID=22663 RepID=A0A2I0IJM9_PUNGR|nr:hypothetical protein CRG98_035390 [Punica granatum]
MENNNWRPAPPGGGGPGGGGGAGGEAVPEGDDWRKHLPQESRQRIVNKIMETLKRHLPFSGPEGLHELRKIAVRFEEKIFHAAVNQPDYLRKISLKMLTMETKSQNSVANSMPSGSAGNGSKPPDSVMQPHLGNQGPSMPNQMVGNQPQVRQQLLSQNIQNNMPTSGVQGSAGLTSTLPPVSGTNQTSIPNIVNQNTNMQNMPNVSQNSLGNPTGQGLASNMFVHPRQMSGRQQVVSQQQQQQQPQNQQQYLYQQQLQNHIMKQKLQQGNIQHSMMPSHMQQQQQPQQQQQSQQNMLQPNQIQPAQQSVMQSSTVMQSSGMQAAPLPDVQQNQQPSIQQTSQPMLQQHQQPVMRHQTQPQQAVHQQQTSLQQQQMMPSQQQQPNMQQKQMISQQNNMVDMQQQQHRMLNQQNNLPNLQQQQPQQQQLMSQQNHLSNLHQQQMAPQTNVSGMHQQQPVMGTQTGNSNMQAGQHSVHMLQQPKVSVQQGSSNMMPGQPSQLPPVQQQLMSQMQPQPGQLQQQVGLQQQQSSLQRDMHQRLQASGSVLQPPQNVMDQQKQLYQNQRGHAEASSMPLDSTAQAGQANGGDWQEEIYKKIKYLKDSYGQDLNEMYQKIATKLQQVTVGSMPQNPVSAPQQVNVSAMSSQGGLSMLQSNINNLQANSNVLPQNLKQQQEQQMQQQFKQQYQQRQIQLIQQKQQLMQQQQQQQLSQQAKQQQQQQLPTQLQAHQMSQLHPMNEVNEMKIRPGMGVKPGVFQQHQLVTGQRPAYPHQQLKPGSSFPISSPQLLQAVSPQIPQHSSPQIDQQNLLTSITKTGTPLQSASSPFVVPSPSTPLAPSPMPADSENQKPASGISSLSNAGSLGHQHITAAPAGAQSLAIGTPGISASPLLAECSGPDGAHVVASTAVSGKSTVTEYPIERLIRAVKSASPQALGDAVNDIGSVVSMVDRIAGSAPGNGSRAAIGEDLVAMTKCRMQARNFIMQDGPSGTKKIRRYTSAMPLSVASSAGSMNDSFKQIMGAETSDLESTASSSAKRSRSEANHVLKEEIREINQRLIDTVVDISDEDVDPTAAAAVAEGGDGVVVRCSFNAVSLSPGLKSQYGSAQLSPIQPLRLLVPSNYPNCSPVLLDKFPVEVSKEYEDLSAKAKSRFSISLRRLSQPMSLKDIARTWDNCSRAGAFLRGVHQNVENSSCCEPGGRGVFQLLSFHVRKY